MKETRHIAAIAAEKFTPGSKHDLSEGGRTILENWTKSLLESVFLISLPANIKIDVVSLLTIEGVIRGIANISWKARFSGDTQSLSNLENTFVSSTPIEVEDGIYEITMQTDTSLYGSENSLMSLVQN